MFTTQELADYLRLEASDIDEANVEQLKREARVKLRRAAPRLPEDDSQWPEAANVVALRVVARGYAKTEGAGPGGVAYGAASMSHSAGPFSQSVTLREESTTPGVWLTKEDLKDLGEFRSGGAYMVDQAPRYLRERGEPRWWETI